ncbi:MAG TPA: cytochrome c3 family protein [Gammaproteobacteria bacterium]|jgi:predicted CXXCH cytochrome family protein|nr:cytochrome c3 family protein [Gammaproteobacteria bacterium]
MRRGLVIVALLLAPGLVLAQARISSNFDHFTTGFDLDGAHRTVDCETCHVAGVFRGTPTQCGSCHIAGGRIRASAKPASHPLTTENCSDCHRTNAWIPLARMNHDAVFGTCMSCHNNVFSVGKPPQHPPTPAGADCDACHRTTAWLPARFNHAGVTQACASCHDGVGATGKNATHITTTNNCEACHNTVSFAAVARVDHAEVIGTCVSCHNGRTATGKTPDHPPSNDSCNNCHTTTAWTPARQ